MNVIVDASTLGIGFYHSQSRTGVSRVSEQLVTGLADQPFVQLSLAASTYLPETMRYTRKRFSERKIDFANRKKILEHRLLRITCSPFLL